MFLFIKGGFAVSFALKAFEFKNTAKGKSFYENN